MLVGVWLGSKAEMSINQFVEDVAKFAPNPPATAGRTPGTPKEKYVPPIKLPSRVLVRNVLRTRVQVARELRATLLALEGADARVKSSFWLAERYGGDLLPVDSSEAVPEYAREWPQGARGAREVVAFLRGRGARLGSAATADYWAADSDDEGVTDHLKKNE